jgi:hypothetical protein
MDIYWKLRKAVREQAEAAPSEFNKAERAPVRSRNLPVPWSFQKNSRG